MAPSAPTHSKLSFNASLQGLPIPSIRAEVLLSQLFDFLGNFIGHWHHLVPFPEIYTTWASRFKTGTHSMTEGYSRGVLSSCLGAVLRPDLHAQLCLGLD